MLKNITSLVLLSCLLLSAGSARADVVVYQDAFDNDGLGTNTGIGGGLTSRSLRSTHHHFDDTGVLQFVATGNTHFQNRVVAYTDNSFQSAGGFELTVNYFNSSYGGASALAFGLVSDDTDFSTYSGFNPFTVASHYGFGVKTDDGDLTFTNGTTATTLVDSPELPLNVDTDVVLRFVNNGLGGANWAWSVGGVSRGSGDIATFDFTKSFQFVAYGQDDQGNKRINSVSLAAVPEPSSFAILALGMGMVGLRIRRRRQS